MEQNNVEVPTATKKIVILLVLALVVVGAAFLLAWGMTKKSNTQVQPGSENNVAFERPDLAKIKSDKGKLLAGLPLDLPIEPEKVTDKYIVEYPNLNASQYTITANIDSLPAEVYKTFLDYMTSAGFDFTEGSKVPPAAGTSGYLSATRDNDDMTVSVVSQSGGTQVQITYLDRTITEE